MTAKQIYDVIMRHEPEWIRAFNELVKLYKEAAPDHRMIALDMIRKGGETVKLNDLRNLPLLQTRSIADAYAGDTETFRYIAECLGRFYKGDYGEVPEENTEANNNDLRVGEGHVLARYEEKYMLDNDIYIETYFSDSTPGIDANHIMIMYCLER